MTHYPVQQALHFEPLFDPIFRAILSSACRLAAHGREESLVEELPWALSEMGRASWL